MNNILAVSLFVLVAVMTSQAQLQNGSGCFSRRTGWLQWSSCGRRQKEAAAGVRDHSGNLVRFNAEPIICFDAFPGGRARRSSCVEGLLCGSKDCAMPTSNGNTILTAQEITELKRTCFTNIVNECGSLNLTPEDFPKNL